MKQLFFYQFSEHFLELLLYKINDDLDFLKNVFWLSLDTDFGMNRNRFDWFRIYFNPKLFPG